MNINKRCGKLKVRCFKTPNVSYTEPLPARRRNETVEHKFKILKRKLKHIIGILTDLKDFVFAQPQKKEAYAHCTHLQIAQTDTQTKICKRVQFLPTYKLTPKQLVYGETNFK